MHIGNHRSRYNDGILLLLGPHLPHTNFGNRSQGNVEIVAQFDLGFIGSKFLLLPEMQDVKSLLQHAGQGLIFSKDVQDDIGKKLMTMFSLDPFQRMVQLLDILNSLSDIAKYEVLNSGVSPMRKIDYERINIVYAFVNGHFHEQIDLSMISDQVNLSIPAFCRFFKKATCKTFNQFLTEYRVTLACQALEDESKSVIEISMDCGFGDISNFNRQFKKVTGTTPSQYRVAPK